MRLSIAIPALSAIAALVACAGVAEPGQYSRDFERLAAECRDRGGMLTPIPGSQTGRPQTDYACEIHGASRLDRAD